MIRKTNPQRFIQFVPVLAGLLLMLTLSGAQAGEWIPENQTLSLFVGDVRVIRVGNAERVAVGNGKLLSTSLTGRGQLIILPEKEGETLIHLWGKTGWERNIRVRIAKSNPRTAVAEIQNLLRDATNLRVRSVGGRAVIEGIMNPVDAERVKAIKTYYPDTIVLARPNEVYHDRMIHMKVQITEFSSSALEELGIDWQTAISGPAAGFAAQPEENPVFRIDPQNGISGLPTEFNGERYGFFGIATAITSRINFMVSNGDALILASPTLTARSGGKAEFLSGGEVPLTTVNSQGQTNTEYKEYGISLEISPAADDAGNITARIKTELSAIDQGRSSGGTFAFLTRRAETDISARSGQTIVISGLLNSELGKDVSGIKYLSAIPVLGALFRSTRLRNTQSELVIFVTPTIIDADSQINREAVAQHDVLIRRFREATELEDWVSEGSPNADLLE